MKNLALTPASQATTMPPDAINIEVPRSGWVATKIIGPMRAAMGNIKYLKLFIFSIDKRW